MELLKIEHLSKVYGKGENKVVALNDVSLTIEKANLRRLLGRLAQENQLFCI